MASQRSNDDTMMAAVVYEAGGPEVFRVEKRLIPKPVGDDRHYMLQLIVLISRRGKARY